MYRSAHELILCSSAVDQRIHTGHRGLWFFVIDVEESKGAPRLTMVKLSHRRNPVSGSQVTGSTVLVRSGRCVRFLSFGICAAGN